jgi:hypothetical protein
MHKLLMSAPTRTRKPMMPQISSFFSLWRRFVQLVPCRARSMCTSLRPTSAGLLVTLHTL